MDDDQDDDLGGNVISMNQPKMNIRERIAAAAVPPAAPHVTPGRPEAEPPPPSAPPEQDDPLPLPQEAYKAHSRAANKPQPTLYFVTRGHAFEGFSYACLERIRLLPPKHPGGGLLLVLRFSGSVVTEVTVEGRNRTCCAT